MRQGWDVCAVLSRLIAGADAYGSVSVKRSDRVGWLRSSRNHPLAYVCFRARAEAMAPPTRTPPSKWIEEGLRALGAGGPDAVRVEALARTLGVTKGGFYNYFDDRPALLDEMHDTWEGLGVGAVIEEVEGEGGGGRGEVGRVF